MSFSGMDQYFTLIINNERGRKFRCNRCYKLYLHKKTVLRHIRMECGKKPSFGCPLCSYQGYQKSHLKSHIVKNHHYYNLTNQ